MLGCLGVGTDRGGSMLKLSTCSCRGDRGTELRSGAMFAFVCSESASIVRQERAVGGGQVLILDRQSYGQCSQGTKDCRRRKKKGSCERQDATWTRGETKKGVNRHSTKGRGGNSTAKTRWQRQSGLQLVKSQHRWPESRASTRHFPVSSESLHLLSP
jgi:hypothetical protein